MPGGMFVKLHVNKMIEHWQVILPKPGGEGLSGAAIEGGQ
jgi:hypothetical protein